MNFILNTDGVPHTHTVGSPPVYNNEICPQSIYDKSLKNRIEFYDVTKAGNLITIAGRARADARQ